jgi:CheY-like chemotaxis protein
MADLLAGRRVLVVEDEMIILMAIEDMLTDLGCTDVTAAPSVAKALALINAQPFDVAMLDANLGQETSEPIADALAARKIPFFFATGYRDLDAGGLHNNRHILRKPFQLADLERSFSVAMSIDAKERTADEPRDTVKEPM